MQNLLLHLQIPVCRIICNLLKSLTRYFQKRRQKEKVDSKVRFQDELEAKAQRRARRLASQQEVDKTSSSSLAEWQKKADKMKKKQEIKQARRLSFSERVESPAASQIEDENADQVMKRGFCVAGVSESFVLCAEREQLGSARRGGGAAGRAAAPTSRLSGGTRRRNRHALQNAPRQQHQRRCRTPRSDCGRRGRGSRHSGTRSVLCLVRLALKRAHSFRKHFQKVFSVDRVLVLANISNHFRRFCKRRRLSHVSQNKLQTLRTDVTLLMKQKKNEKKTKT